MSSGYRRRNGWIGAAVLIGVGVVGLLANFNIISEPLLDQLWKLWPVIPLAIGVSILFGRNRYLADHPRDPGHD